MYTICGPLSVFGIRKTFWLQRLAIEDISKNGYLDNFVVVHVDLELVWEKCWSPVVIQMLMCSCKQKLESGLFEQPVFLSIIITSCYKVLEAQNVEDLYINIFSNIR